MADISPTSQSQNAYNVKQPFPNGHLYPHCARLYFVCSGSFSLPGVGAKTIRRTTALQDSVGVDSSSTEVSAQTSALQQNNYVILVHPSRS